MQTRVLLKEGKINQERQDISTPTSSLVNALAHSRRGQLPRFNITEGPGCAMRAVCSGPRVPLLHLPDLIVKGTAQGPEHLWAPPAPHRLSVSWEVQGLEIRPQKVVEAGKREADRLLGIRCKDRAQPCPAGGPSTGGGLGGGVHSACCPCCPFPLSLLPLPLRQTHL